MGVSAEVRIDIEDYLPSCTDPDFLQLIRTMCKSIDREDIIEKVRAIVNKKEFDNTPKNKASANAIIEAVFDFDRRRPRVLPDEIMDMVREYKGIP